MKVFIVNEGNSANVISKNLLTKNVKESLPKDVKVKQKDIDLYCDELMNELMGRALSYDIYEDYIEHACDALVIISTTSPYQLYNKYIKNYAVNG